MKDKILRVKEDFEPLYHKGDLFKIVQINNDPDLMDIEAMRLKDGQIYGFSKDELEEVKWQIGKMKHQRLSIQFLIVD